MRIQAQLMMTLKAHIARTGMTKAQAVARFGISQSRVADLMRGKVDLFALDSLVNMTAMASARNTGNINAGDDLF